MADEREQGRLRECEAMGHVWPKRPPAQPARSTLRFYSTPSGWRDLYDHVEWTEACERCGKLSEVSVFLCEAEGVDLLTGQVSEGLVTVAGGKHTRFAGSGKPPTGFVWRLGPMLVVSRFRLDRTVLGGIPVWAGPRG